MCLVSDDWLRWHGEAAETNPVLDERRERSSHGLGFLSGFVFHRHPSVVSIPIRLALDSVSRGGFLPFLEMTFGHGLINGGQGCLARIDDEVVDFQSRSKGGRR